MDHPAHSVAILAGGLATRFGGRDKGALLVDGRTILDRQIAEFSALTDDLMIVGAAGAAREGTAVARRQSSDDTGKVVPRRIVDLVEACGPLGGLHAALTEAWSGAVFLVAGDMPYVTARFATYLLSLADEADIVVPQTERGYHPLCAVYTRACLATVAARLADRRLRMRELIGDMPTRVVTTEEIERFGDRHMLLANVNTPAEYAGLEALQGHKP